MDGSYIVKLISGRIARMALGAIAGILAYIAGQQASQEILAGADMNWVQTSIEGILSMGLAALSFYWSHRKDGAHIEAAATATGAVETMARSVHTLAAHNPDGQVTHEEAAKKIAAMVAAQADGTDQAQLIADIIEAAGLSVRPNH